MCNADGYIALGSNLGDARQIFGEALERLSSRVSVLGKSRLYATRPYGLTEQPNFSNAVLRVSRDESLCALWPFLQEIEQALGKVVLCENGPRSLDLDIIFWGDRVGQFGEIQLPHPRCHERDFVLQPMCDLCPNFFHPVYQKGKRYTPHCPLFP